MDVVQEESQAIPVEEMVLEEEVDEMEESFSQLDQAGDNIVKACLELMKVERSDDTAIKIKEKVIYKYVIHYNQHYLSFPNLIFVLFYIDLLKYTPNRKVLMKY